jgi:hypothetical protein
VIIWAIEVVLVVLKFLDEGRWEFLLLLRGKFVFFVLVVGVEGLETVDSQGEKL